VEDLLSARDPRSYDLDTSLCLLDRRKQALSANGDREFVMLFLETERAGHPATARIDLLDGETRDQAQGVNCRAGPDRSLLMAVAVEENAPFRFPKSCLKLTPTVALDEELLDEKAVLRHCPASGELIKIGRAHV
jgi:hypothetical protein